MVCEAKNGAVVRKQWIHTYRGAACGGDRAFYEEHFNPYLNFHRPCGVPRAGGQRQGQKQETVPVVCDTLGDFCGNCRDWLATLKLRDDQELEQKARAQTDSKAAKRCKRPRKALH